MFIIGIDPGVSLGIAVMYYPRILDAYQGDVINGINYLKELLTTTTTTGDDVYVAIEKYVMTPGSSRKKGGDKIAQLVQRCEGIVLEYPTARVYFQSVSDASRFNNDMLRKLNLYIPATRVQQKDANDANSAVRHILLFLARNKATLYEKLMTKYGVM